MSAMKSAHSIRVNLRFGPRTDPELIREIAALPPYRRAKLLRKLLEAGWRHRLEGPSAVPARASVAVAQPTMPESADAGFSQDILALAGKSVRL